MAYSLNLSVNLNLIKIWRTPKDFSRTPGGMRTPGWEPLVYAMVSEMKKRSKGRSLAMSGLFHENQGEDGLAGSVKMTPSTKFGTKLILP